MGRIPDRFARQGARQHPEWFKDGRIDFPKAKSTRQSKKDVRATKPLRVSTPFPRVRPYRMLTAAAQDIITSSDMINRHFLDLVTKLLAWDPAQRITVREALSHPYFSLSIPEEI